jgi:hypothetical protein
LDRSQLLIELSPLQLINFKSMFQKFFLSLCLLCVLCTSAFAQGKPELQSKSSDTLAPRAILARPPQSGNEPMLLLAAKNRPMTEPIAQTTKLEYFDCDGIVAPWFRSLLVAEMNYFAELSELPFIKGDACVVSIATSKSLTPGRISVHFYSNTQRLTACIRSEQCPVFRSISLIPKDLVLYRSYFLSDMSRKLISQHCVTDKGKLHSNTTCYTVP